jgi:3-oxoacyl-[acyl-carrier-protein] synthase II
MQRDPVALLALCAAQDAVSKAGLSTSLKDQRSNSYFIDDLEAHRAGVFMGTGIGGAHTFLDNHAHQILACPGQALRRLRQEEKLSPSVDEKLHGLVESMVYPARFNPFVVPMLMPNAVSAALGIKYSLHGPNNTYCLACASGTVAVGEAFRAVRRGDVDFALTGGSEYLYDHCGGIFRGFDVAKTLVRDCADPDWANRPFDERRSGFLFSEGAAAVLVVEEYEKAVARGAPVMAEIVGYAETFDAHCMMSNATDGAQIERMFVEAIADAGLAACDIDYVNAHGTGTELNDSVEARVLERFFGHQVLVNSTKSILGHTIGASGAMEAAVTVLSIQNQTTHVCRNLENPIVDLNFVRCVEPQTISTGVSHSFAFGGHNAALVVRACS